MFFFVFVFFFVSESILDAQKKHCRYTKKLYICRLKNALFGCVVNDYNFNKTYCTMTRFLSIILLALLLPISAMSQVEWLQPEERTADNPQIHKQDILDRLPDDDIIAHALRTPYVKPEYKVYDFCGTLTAEGCDDIYIRAINMKTASDVDAAIVFISEDTWDDYDNEQFIWDFYDYNDFGCGKNHDGICVIVNMATHRFAIFDTGTPTQYNLVGSNLDKYIALLQPYFRANNYSGGIVALLTQFEEDWRIVSAAEGE